HLSAGEIRGIRLREEEGVGDICGALIDKRAAIKASEHESSTPPPGTAGRVDHRIRLWVTPTAKNATINHSAEAQRFRSLLR
ncbi:hypothetical protein AVEN_67888-1, partial [Araneus ventricosus]